MSLMPGAPLGLSFPSASDFHTFQWDHPFTDSDNSHFSNERTLSSEQRQLLFENQIARFDEMMESRDLPRNTSQNGSDTRNHGMRMRGNRLFHWRTQEEEESRRLGEGLSLQEQLQRHMEARKAEEDRAELGQMYQDRREEKETERLNIAIEENAGEEIAVLAFIALHVMVLPRHEFFIFRATDFLFKFLETIRIPFSLRILATNVFTPWLVYELMVNSPRAQVRQKFDCLQPVNVGVLLEPVRRYYYDSSNDQCVAFTYEGAGGNENRFDNKRTCEVLCRPKSSEGRQELGRTMVFANIIETIDLLMGAADVRGPMRYFLNLLLSLMVSNRE